MAAVEKPKLRLGEERGGEDDDCGEPHAESMAPELGWKSVTATQRNKTVI
jgi:hypothetical protein